MEPTTPPSAWQLLRAKQTQSNLQPPRFSSNGELSSQFTPHIFDTAHQHEQSVSDDTAIHDSIADLKSWMSQIQKDANENAQDRYKKHAPLLMTELPASVRDNNSPLASPSRRRQPSASDRHEAKLLLKTWHKVDTDTSKVKASSRKGKTNLRTNMNYPESELNFDKRGSNQYSGYSDVQLDECLEPRQSKLNYSSLTEMNFKNIVSTQPNFNDSFDGLFDETEEDRERIERLLPPAPNVLSNRSSSHISPLLGQMDPLARDSSSIEPSYHAKSRNLEQGNVSSNMVSPSKYEIQAKRIREKEKQAMFDISCDIFIRRKKRKRLGRCFVGWVTYTKTSLYKMSIKLAQAHQLYERTLTSKVFAALRGRHHLISDFKFRLSRKRLKRKYHKLWIKWKSETRLLTLKIIQFQKQQQWGFLCKVFFSWYDYTVFLVNERKKAHAKIKEIELMQKEKAAIKWHVLRVYSKVFLEWCVHVEDIKKERKAIAKHKEEKARIAKFVQRIAVIDHTSDEQQSKVSESEPKKEKNPSQYDYKLNQTRPDLKASSSPSIQSEAKDVEVFESLEKLENMLVRGSDSSPLSQSRDSRVSNESVGDGRLVKSTLSRDVLSSMERRAEERKKGRENLKLRRQADTVTPPKAPKSKSMATERSQRTSSLREERYTQSRPKDRRVATVGKSHLNTPPVRTIENHQESEAVKVALQLAQLHYKRSLLIYYGIKPWLTFTKMKHFDQVKADNFHQDRLLVKYWKEWLSGIKLEKMEKLRGKGDAILWTLDYLERRQLKRYFRRWWGSLKDLYAMAIAVENMHKFRTITYTMVVWKRAYESEKSRFYSKYHQVRECQKHIRQRATLRNWHEVLLRKRMDDEVTRRREQRWKQVRGWLNTEL